MDIEKGKEQDAKIVYQRVVEFQARGPRSLDPIVLRVAGGVMLIVDTLLHPNSYALLNREFDNRKVALYRERKSV